MSYSIQIRIAHDGALMLRVAAALATQDVLNSVETAKSLMWSLAAQPGWSAAYESGLVTYGVDELNPLGKKEDVITDGMILSAVQALLADIKSGKLVEV